MSKVPLQGLSTNRSFTKKSVYCVGAGFGVWGVGFGVWGLGDRRVAEGSSSDVSKLQKLILGLIHKRAFTKFLCTGILCP